MRKFRVGDVVQAVQTKAEFTITAIEDRPGYGNPPYKSEAYYVGWWSKGPEDGKPYSIDPDHLDYYPCSYVEDGKWVLAGGTATVGLSYPAALLKLAFPYGHPDFIPDLIGIAKLHSDKNHDYAKGGDPLGNFERVAALMRLYPDFPWATPHGNATVQMLKQLDAFMWMQSAKTEAKVEGFDSRLRDIQVFAGLIRIILRARQASQQAYTDKG